MPKTILFDLDGTLTDSGEGIMNCARTAMEAFGIPIPDQSVMRSIVGPPLDESFLHLGFPADKIDEAIAVFRKRYFELGKYENFPYPGIEQLLQNLCRQGHTLCVATSKPEVMAVDILDHFGLAPYFRFICGATLDRSRISKEDVITYLIEQCGRSENMVMVGDTCYDVLGARAHGIPTVGVCWGYGEPQAMLDAGAAALAEDMEALEMLLN